LRSRRHPRLAILAATALAVLAVAPVGNAALTRPAIVGPANAAAVKTVPVFQWKAVPGAHHYQFQISADADFASPPLGGGDDDFDTRNTYASLKKTLPDGTYWWRVKAWNEAGTRSSAWSTARTIVKSWSDAPAPQSPANTGTLRYPDPVLLNWTAVPGAKHYRVTLSRQSDLSTPVAGFPVTTAATAFSAATRLQNGTYYWQVTPIDAQNHDGAESPIWSFTYQWDTATELRLEDLDARAEVFDPYFEWDPIRGAARYQIEINYDQNFASGSKVCCADSTIATSFTPQTLLPADTYYWRVRAVDPTGSVNGQWNVYDGTFSTHFDALPEPIPALDMGADLTDGGIAWQPGYETDTPIVTWDPVPGASSYQVQVVPFISGQCDANPPIGYPKWTVDTAATAWTPLGLWQPPGNTKPYEAAQDIAYELPQMRVGESYCVTVRAQRSDDTEGHVVYGNPAQLGDSHTPSFTFTGYPAGDTCDGNCVADYLGGGDYQLPAAGSGHTRLPLFTWEPLAGKSGYYVIVARDQNFQNVIDYAFTRVPAYAPRLGLSFGPQTYAETTSSYYWVVLPADNGDGSGVSNDLEVAPGLAAGGTPLAPRSFQKALAAPTPLAPADGAPVSDQPSFRWTAVDGAERYELYVSQDENFGTLLGGDLPGEAIYTAETSHTTETTFDATKSIYWQVAAIDARGRELAKSPVRTFSKSVAKPTFLHVTNPTTGDFIPVLQWDAVQGAIGYDISVHLPDGSDRPFNEFDTTAFTATLMTGTGKFDWKVRSVYPTATPGTYVRSDWTTVRSFTRTIHAPTDPTSTASGRTVLLRWNPKAHIEKYRLQIATGERFSLMQLVEFGVDTDNPHYAPRLTEFAYRDGGKLYWRVAAVDEDGNVGAYTQPKTFAIPRRLVVTQSGYANRFSATTVSIIVKDAKGNPIKGARVVGSGAGITLSAKLTGSTGKVSWSKIRARRSGTITFTVTAPNADKAVLKQSVF
jgi:hypothetical protein